MTNLTAVASFDDVPQLETTTVAMGGAGGIMNAQAQALLNRTEHLANICNDLNLAVGELNPTEVLDTVESNSTTAALAAHTGKLLWQEITNVQNSHLIQHVPKTADYAIDSTDFTISGHRHLSFVNGATALTVSLVLAELGVTGQSLCIFNDGTIPCILDIGAGITVWGDATFTTQHEGKRISVLGTNAIRIVNM